MPHRHSLRVALASIIIVGLINGVVPEAQAKTLVGTACSKLGAKTGDGPSRTVICVKKGKKKVWKALILKRTDKPSNAQPSSTKPSTEPSTQPSEQPSNSSGSTCQKLPEFTENFIDPAYVRVVTPIGEQTGSGGVIAVRSYIHPSNTFLGKELPIYAPVDMTLSMASFYKPPGAAANYQPEYSLYFEVGCGITVKFFHIKGIVGKVATAVPSEPSPSSAGQAVGKTPVKAGEQIGWYKLGEDSVAFDFWVDNETHTNNFIVPSHFAESNALHSVCPYGFYTPDRKALWLAKLGAPGSDPISGTACGVVTEGVEGTADGMWFISPNTKTDHLTYDGAYQSQIMFSVDPSGILRIGGLNTSGTLSQMMVSPQSSTWLKPSDVKVGSSHCWSTDLQSVAVKVMDNKTMSVVVGTESCSTLPDPSTGKTYYR
ncbi:MAG TPA: hypothetical protein VMW30_08510 [Candidatus Paceibacterota bacterium]|nr:hypothetical protein [Candidatus Paceibacterota bacterium]